MTPRAVSSSLAPSGCSELKTALQICGGDNPYEALVVFCAVRRTSDTSIEGEQTRKANFPPIRVKRRRDGADPGARHAFLFVIGYVVTDEFIGLGTPCSF